MSSNFALALILGNPGSEDKNVKEEIIETPELPCVWKDFVQIKEFLEECACVINSGTACDTDLDRHNCLDRMGAFFKQCADVYILVYLGKGREIDGGWILAEEYLTDAEDTSTGTITLEDIVNCWTEKHKEDDSKLFIYSDSCHSGHLVARARHYEEQMKPWHARLFVQASCAREEKAMDGRFTPMWVEAHRRTPHEPFSESDMDTFLQGGDTTQKPMFYAPGNLHLVDLGVRFLQSLNGDAGDNKEYWEVIRDNLPIELQPIVNNFAERWAKDPQFSRLVADIRGLAQRESRRGGNLEEDYTDLVEFLEDKLGDSALELKALVEEFNAEFC